jgi:hypothetical protein
MISGPMGACPIARSTHKLVIDRAQSFQAFQKFTSGKIMILWFYHLSNVRPNIHKPLSSILYKTIYIVAQMLMTNKEIIFKVNEHFLKKQAV